MAGLADRGGESQLEHKNPAVADGNDRYRDGASSLREQFRL